MDLFNEPGESRNARPANIKNQPLATRMRPRSIEEYAGQQEIIGEGKLLRRMILSGNIGSVIFYGPPSSGKTTLAHVISHEIDASFTTLNAVLDGVKELRKVVEEAQARNQVSGKRTILFVDEIHRWNKAQQDALLPHIESGLLTLIGATTENPFYSLVGPLLSRCQLFELQPFDVQDIITLLERAISDEERGLGEFQVKVDDDALNHFAEYASGDIRNALNAFEMAVKTTDPDENGTRHITIEVAQDSIQKRVVRYAGQGDEHYHYASAFIKSMRGSDPDAALYWMCAMLEGGEDPVFIFRRMLIFASEDIGLAEPKALELVNASFEAFRKCGMPEGLYFLSHCCLYLSLCPKSNTTKAIFGVLDHIRKKGISGVPPHLKDKTANKLKSNYTGEENFSDSYIYPHDHPGNWVEQQYLPDDLHNSGSRWYEQGHSAVESRLNERLRELKKSR